MNKSQRNPQRTYGARVMKMSAPLPKFCVLCDRLTDVNGNGVCLRCERTS